MVTRYWRKTSGLGMAMSVALVLSGCNDLSQPYNAPTIPFLKKYNSTKSAAPVLLSNAAWWRGLNDPVLSQLIDSALQDNISLKLARERVVAAKAARKTVPGETLLSSSAGVQARDDTNSRASLQGTASLGLTWMLDPYGARRGQLRAASARIEVAEAEVDAARLLLLFNIANAYTTLRHDQTLLALSKRELGRRQNTLGLTRTLQDAESATRLDIAQAQARVAEIHAQLPGQKAAVTATLNEIAVLTGKAPNTLPKRLTALLSNNTGQPTPKMSPDVGIPADLLRNRPDIHIAERGYYAAVADIGVARAELYPRLSLSGTITLNALSGGNPAVEYFFGPAVQFPNLPTQQAQARVAARHSTARQTYIQWKSTVLTAILEVENALVAYQSVSTSIASARKARRLYAEALSLTREVFKAGEATLNDLIDAEQALSQADRTLIDQRRQHALRFIALNVRLGAGSGTDRPKG